MFKISRDKVFKNINTHHEIPVEIQKRLMNGNAQFLMDFANHMKAYLIQMKFRQSYSITSLAIYLSHYFFLKRSHLDHDRFIINTACFLLASKIRDADTKIKTLAFTYHKLVSKIYENQGRPIQPINDSLLHSIKEKICIAESLLLKSIGFNFEIVLPYDYLDQLVRRYYNKENLYYLSKILIFDMYRSHICLCYLPLVMTLAAIVIASGYYEQDIVPQEYLQVLQIQQQIQNTEEYKIDEEKMQQLDEQKNQQFIKWIDHISEEFNVQFNYRDIIECIQECNEFLEFFQKLEN